MRFNTQAPFAASAVALAAAPGPNPLFVLSSSGEVGLRRNVDAMMGCVSALFVFVYCVAAELCGGPPALRARSRPLITPEPLTLPTWVQERGVEPRSG